MTVLQYLEYQGDVVFDEDHLVVRILHIDDFITTNVDNASEAHAAFVELVDDYIASCQELGKEPCKPFKGSFNVRMAPKLHKQVAFAAAAAGQSLNSYVVQALEDELHANEVDAISNSVARTMAEYVMQRSQRRQEASPWQFLDSDMPVDFGGAWARLGESRHVSVPTRFLKSWIHAHYGERLLSTWQAEPQAEVYARPGRDVFLVGPIARK
jgi:predicted HicB family RNase H-like nuclease